MNSEHLGDSNQQSLAEIWNSQPVRDMRVDMLANRPGKGCERCYKQESMGLGSSRLYSNRLLQHHHDLLGKTGQDGQLSDMRMAYMDVRISNICNLRCRSCSHMFSSAWYDETVNSDPNYTRPRILTLRPEIISELMALLSDVEEVYWAGGESLLIPEHWQIVDAWLAMDKTDVRMEYTTNFTNLRYKDRSILDVWARFADVTVSASLDAEGARANYLRKPCDWEQVLRNRRDMIERCPHVRFMITPTVSLMNAWHVSDLHRSWVEQDLLDIDEIYINMLAYPHQQNVTVATPAYKLIIQEKIDRHIQWCEAQGAGPLTVEKWQGLISWMNAEDHSHLLDQFWTQAVYLDASRGEDVFSVWPELAWLHASG